MNTSKRHGEFLALIEEHKRLLFKVCWSYSAKQHDRDDLLQEIVAQLWSAFPKYDRHRPFSTWMYRVALNVSIDFRRRDHRRKESQMLDDMSVFASPDKQGRIDELWELHELLEKQSEADRAILLLHLEGNSHREIGEVLGISESNVGTRMSRIKKSLRRQANSQAKVS